VRQHYPDVDLREWQPYQRPETPEMAAVEPSPEPAVHALPEDVRETAADLLRRLVGVPLTTLTGRPNRILAVSPPHVIVATERSPQGQRVPIADLERALGLLRRDGVVTITPAVIGHRSSFLGAVLLTLPGSQTTGSPPRLTIGPTHLSPASTSVKSGEQDGDRQSAGRQPSATGYRHVFISYVREDSAAVDQLQEALEAAGIRVWRDTADLWPGEDWRAMIRSAITDDALVFIACFSHKSLARRRSYQNEELALAIDQMRQRRPDEPWLVPVRFDDCEIPDLNLGGGRSLSAIHRADVFPGSFDKGAQRLTTAVLRILARQDDIPQR
jgi:TIR domain